MNISNTPESQRKRRFYLFFTLAIMLACSAFYSGFQIGKVVGKKEIFDAVRKKNNDTDIRIM